MFVLLFGLLLFESRCRLFFAADEIEQLDALSTIVGEVTSPNPMSEPVIVAVFRKERDRRVLRSYSVLLQAGPYEVQLSPGPCEIWAFEDLDRDFKLDDGEPLGSATPNGVMEPKGGKVLTANISLAVGRRQPDAPAIDLSSTRNSDGLDAPFTTIGEIVSLDDPRFSASRGVYGSWRPLSTIRRRGLGVFFTEPYDPCRVPILFVHGMSGTPREFQALVDAASPTKFQAWFFTYPSSLRLSTLSSYLENAIRTLGVRYELDHLIVVAHSMGGLVARDFINQNVAEKKKALISTFISLSTPWNGHRSAESGIDFSPVVIPSWVDMVPNSRFISSIYESPFPEYVKHYLWFGFVDGDAGDEVITTASMLDPRAQDGAVEIRGFAANHRQILNHPSVIVRFRAVLRQAAGDGPASRVCSTRAPRSAPSSRAR